MKRAVSGPLRVFFVAWAALSLLAIGWALASPVGSGPDEPSHYIKAASVVRGQLVGPQGENGNIVEVPRYVQWTTLQGCFHFKPEVTASCAPDVQGNPSDIAITQTSAGYYNPVYYAMVGWPTLIFGDVEGLYAMRIVSGIIASAILALSFMLVSTWTRRLIPMLGLMAAMTPMVIYVNGIVNPSAFEISGTLTVFVAMLSIVTHPSPKLLRGRVAILVVAAALALGARTISPLWILLALVLPLILVPWPTLRSLLRRRAVIVGMAVVGLVAVASLAWNPLSTRLAQAAATTGDQPAVAATFPDTGRSPLFGFVKMITLSVTNGDDMIGNFGWMDTPVPDTTIVVWTILMGSLVLLAAYFLRGRKAVFGASLLLLFFFLPPVIQAGFISTGGYIWQGRYGLPILVMLVFGLAATISLTLQKRSPDLSSLTRVALIAVVGWGFGQGYAFLSALHRNVVGSLASWRLMITAPDWTPPGGVFGVLAIFSIGLVILMLLVLRLHLNDRKTPVVSEGESSERSAARSV